MLSGPSLVSDQDHQRERSALPTTYSLTDIGSSSSALFTRTLLDRGLQSCITLMKALLMFSAKSESSCIRDRFTRDLGPGQMFWRYQIASLLTLTNYEVYFPASLQFCSHTKLCDIVCGHDSLCSEAICKLWCFQRQRIFGSGLYEPSNGCSTMGDLFRGPLQNAQAQQCRGHNLISLQRCPNFFHITGSKKATREREERTCPRLLFCSAPLIRVLLVLHSGIEGASIRELGDKEGVT